jgi:hypothetical protein
MMLPDALGRRLAMRFLKAIQVAFAASAVALGSGCSNAPTQTPASFAAQSHTLGIMFRTGYHGAGFNTCPATGLLVYVSDQTDGTVNIFAGHLAGQAPCGILTGFNNGEGLMVSSGNLYVTKGPPFPNVQAYHRGGTSPFKTYVDATCGDEVPGDVTVSGDGYVIASNLLGRHCSSGSISVWNKSSGALVANYQSANAQTIIFLTIQKDGTLYYSDGTPGLWVGKCVAGACTSFTNTGAVFASAGGVRSVSGEHVVLIDSTRREVLTYAPPSFGTPSGTCTIGGGRPIGMDLYHKETRLFVADALLGVAKEFKYPAGGGNGQACALVGSVTTSGGNPVGVAVDPPESL